MQTPFARLLAMVAASVLCLSSLPAHAVGPFKELTTPPDRNAHQVFQENRQQASWRVLESEDCHFAVLYQEGTRKFSRHLALADCSSIVATEYQLQGSDVLIANLASERGGEVLVFQAGAEQLQWAETAYDASEESRFDVARKGQEITIRTDRSAITARLAPDGKIEFRKKALR